MAGDASASCTAALEIVRVGGWVSGFVRVYVKKREGGRLCERERESVCESERERGDVCV